MKLTHENYLFGKKVVDDTLDIDNDKIKFHIRDSVKSFIGDIDTSIMDNRQYIFQFLQHISTLYLNYCLNGNAYFLSDEKIEKCMKSREIIVGIHKDLIKRFNENSKLNISDVISSLTLEDITKIVNAFTDINIPIEAVKEEIELNYL